MLTAEEGADNGVVGEHIMPVATTPLGGLRRGFLHGRIAASSALMSTESLRVGPDGGGGSVVVGDTVMVLSSDGGSEQLPHRLAAVTWDEEEERLVARVNPFLTTEAALLNNPPAVEEERLPLVWEVVTDDGGERVDLTRITTRCDVIPLAQEAGAGSSARRSYTCAGFIRPGRSKGIFRKVWAPAGKPRLLAWRFAGLDNLFFDRRAKGVFANTSQLPVFSVPLVIFTDAFNFFQRIGNAFSVNATHFSIGSTTRSHRRRLSSWHLSNLGAPRARWEEELEHLFKIIGEMQNGCRARLRIGDKTITVRKGRACLYVNMVCFRS